MNFGYGQEELGVAVHCEDLERFPGTLAELAGAIGDLQYDALASFLQSLANKLATDAAADAQRGRHKLAHALRDSAAGVSAAAAAVERAWTISAPHM